MNDNRVKWIIIGAMTLLVMVMLGIIGAAIVILGAL